MKPMVKIANTRTPDGGEMTLFQHYRDFSIMINGEDLMHSRRHESELELARLGCARLVGRKAPRILIGGLGMGYTLRQTLDMLGPDAQVVVGEMIPAVVEWNHEFFETLNGQALNDKRVDLKTGNIIEIISSAKAQFDAILLDVDNGPDPMTDAGNHRLYHHDGILSCQRALKKQGCLSIWSAKPSKPFEQRLISCQFHVRRFRVPAYKGKKPPSHFVWVASTSKAVLPPGGGEPRTLRKKKSKGYRRRR